MVLVLCGHGLVVIHRHWGGRRASHAAYTSRHGSQSGAGLRALGPQGLCVFAGRRAPRPAPRAPGGGGGARALPRRGGLG